MSGNKTISYIDRDNTKLKASQLLALAKAKALSTKNLIEKP